MKMREMPGMRGFPPRAFFTAMGAAGARRPMPASGVTMVAAVVSLALAGTLCGSSAFAQDKKLGWADTAEFSYVVTAGNSETNTLGFKNLLTRTWESALFTLKAGGVRSETATPSLIAVAPDPNNLTRFDVDSGETLLSAESYYLAGAYDRNVSKHFFWHVGAGWDRNVFAGIQNRYVGEAGVGNLWSDTDRRKFRTTYSATFTAQDEVVDNPALKNNFAGARLTSDFMQKFGKTSAYSNTFVFDENLDKTADWRADMINSVAVSMTTHLALKVSLQLLYDHTPSFKNVDLFTESGGNLIPTGQKVLAELDELDTIFTTSLVVNY